MAKTLDQLRADHPITSLDGTETFVVQKLGVTGGGFLSVLREWVLASVNALAITDSTAVGRDVLTATDAAAARTAISAQQELTTVSQVDAEAGTSSVEHNWTPERVRQAIDAVPKATVEVVDPGNIAPTASYANRTTVIKSSTAIDFTLPSSGTEFGPKDSIRLINLGAATVTITGGVKLYVSGTGVETEFDLVTNKMVTLYNLAGNEWFLSEG